MLNRREGESIVVEFEGRRVVLTIDAVKDVKVRVAVDAPRDVLVYRGESEGPRVPPLAMALAVARPNNGETSQ